MQNLGTCIIESTTIKLKSDCYLKAIGETHLIIESYLDKGYRVYSSVIRPKVSFWFRKVNYILELELVKDVEDANN